MGHNCSISGRFWHLLASQDEEKTPKQPQTPKLVDHQHHYLTLTQCTHCPAVVKAALEGLSQSLV